MRKLALFFMTVVSFLPFTVGADGGVNISYTSVPPLATVMRTVGAGHWAAGALVEYGKDPHTFTLTPAIASELSQARVYLALGVEMDAMVTVHAPENMLVVRPGLNVPEYEHDPHMWLDPEGLRLVAESLRDAYIQVDPANEADYAAACAAFEKELAASSAEAAEILAPFRGRRFYVQHAAFAHFASCYGLEQVSLEEHEKEPTATRIAYVIDSARKDGVKFVYAQPGHNPRPLEVVASSIGAQIATLDPLELDPVSSLVTRAKTLAQGFKEEAR